MPFEASADHLSFSQLDVRKWARRPSPGRADVGAAFARHGCHGRVQAADGRNRRFPAEEHIICGNTVNSSVLRAVLALYIQIRSLEICHRMKPIVTRTQNPLPFEHMEPKRFEDMARQLAYEFKPWRQLEATGRSGGDEGFDARGFEIVVPASVPIQNDEDEGPDIEVTSDRIWLIQCKRERTIGPALMAKHLNAIPQESRRDLHGLLFIAACNFSLATRNVLRNWCRIHEIAECIIWGRAELEDLLFQPKNDGLLFAYFGISLRIARQKVATSLRREISLKRKLNRLFPIESRHGSPIVLRDPADLRYPFVDGKSLKGDKCLWLPRNTLGIGTFGLRIVIREFWAFYEWENGRWDIASSIDFSIPDQQSNPWYQQQAEPDRAEKIREIVDLWQQFPPGNQCFVKIVGCLRYEDIIEIDEIGDDQLKSTTVFATFKGARPPYDRGIEIFVEMGRYGGLGNFDFSKHASIFPDGMRNLDWEMAFFEDMGIKRSSDPYPVTLTQPEWKRENR